MDAISVLEIKEQKKRIGFLVFKKKKFNRLVTAIKIEIFYVYLFIVVISLIPLFIFSKNSVHLFLNQFHSSFFDFFFKYATFLGDGILFAILALFFLVIKKKIFYVFTISGTLTLLITHYLKKIVFNGTQRPCAAIGKENLHLVAGEKIRMLHSFPSGHTITAFAICTILCLLYRKCNSQYIWILLAFVAAYSRVYLSQHFLIDIVVGSVIGILIGFSCMYFFGPKKSLIC